jgi:phosphoadenosine phosphosulfate reductase
MAFGGTAAYGGVNPPEEVDGPMASHTWTEDALRAIAGSLEGQPPEAVLRWALQHFGADEIALACSFGAEDMVLLDMIARLRPGSRVFYLDTGLLFPETYDLVNQASARYDVRLEQVLPAMTVAAQAEAHGDALWARNPDQCCHIRKVEPLRQVLAGLSAWITGIRREQSPTRAGAQVVEWDHKFGLVKVNPLAAWSEQAVWGYITAHGVPYNPLHDQGYPSIGCTHCTRPVRPGEDPRAGRWSGLAKTECGLHQ